MRYVQTNKEKKKKESGYSEISQIASPFYAISEEIGEISQVVYCRAKQNDQMSLMVTNKKQKHKFNANSLFPNNVDRNPKTQKTIAKKEFVAVRCQFGVVPIVGCP
jgi:hypothetical protein